MKIPYTLIRSKRKSLSLQISTSGELIVRSPMRLPEISIENFIEQKIEWIQKYQEKYKNIPQRKIFTPNEIKVQKEILWSYIIPRIQELSIWKNLPKITSIKITTSEKRWGSCSSKNWLCFSYRLTEYIGSAFVDAIIIHELAHLIEKNHQKPFWNLVYSWMPNYEKEIKLSQRWENIY